MDMLSPVFEKIANLTVAAEKRKGQSAFIRVNPWQEVFRLCEAATAKC